MEAEAIPLMSMVGEVREDRGVSMVDGMVDRGGDLDFPLPDEVDVEMSSIAGRKVGHMKHSVARACNSHL